jgi:hypothetical protein
MGLALILTFSPWEKEQPSDAAGFAEGCPAHPVAGVLERQEKAQHPKK